MIVCWLHRAVRVGSTFDCRSRGCEFSSQLGHITSIEIDHEIISVAIFPILLIQEGKFSVTDESVCTSSGFNHLED